MTKVINSPEELREELLNYLGTGYFTLQRPVILEYISRVENGNTQNLIDVAIELGLVEG